MSRTYLPTLKVLLSEVCKYISRHRDRIIQVVGEDNTSKVDDVITACNVLMVVLDALIPTPL